MIPQKIEGFKIIIDKTPPKWTGSIYLKSQYKGLAQYVTSSKESYDEAIQEILSKYRHRQVERIEIKQVKPE